MPDEGVEPEVRKSGGQREGALKRISCYTGYMVSNPSGKLIVVSNRLPYTRTEGPSGNSRWEKSSGGLVNALDPILRKQNGIWAGWDGTVSPHPLPQTDIAAIKISSIGSPSAKKTYRVLPVPLTHKEVNKYYTQFSNNTLWALFHYFFEQSSIDYSSWETYKKVNERFAVYISKIAGKNDIIWINDFHLFLCPIFLRRINPGYKIHFFLHIPFPHVDVFATLPWCKEILDSLASCDSVGFQHSRYLKNYIGAVHALSVEKKPRPSRDGGRDPDTPYAYVNPISIDFNKYSKASGKPKVIKRKKELLKQGHGVKMILGVDRLDYSKGLKQKMLGIETLLEAYPSLVGQFVFYQLAVPSRQSVPAYTTLKKNLDEIIGRINGRFSTGTWHPVQYMYTSVDLDELIALYSAANIALVTPLRDGMNLVCKEFVASHADNDGILILSKFAGASTALKNAIAVNPYSIEDISSAVHSALFMKKHERKIRMKRMRENIKKNDIHAWLSKSMDVFTRTGKMK